MNNILAKKFSCTSLLIFAIPNVLMMVSLSMYIIVDGMFISRLLGTTALSAANMVYPLISFEMGVAIMIATGGSAIVAKKLGEGKKKEAQKNVSFLIMIEILIGLCIGIVGNVYVDEIVAFLGVSEVQAPLCITYARILFTFAPAFFLQTAFQTFFVTAGKPTFGLVVTLLAGVVNIILDYIFIASLNMGIAGAAYATGIGYCIPAVAGLIYFFFAKENPLHVGKPEIDWNVLVQACTNGSSEMVTNLANAATTFLFNYTFLQYYGEDGVAAITIILYFQYIFTAVYFGYANGIAPIISYKYGNNDKEQLRAIFKHSIVFLIISAILSNIVLHSSITTALTIFTSYNSNVYTIAYQGMSLYSIAFMIMGLGIFASALFTALSDGKTSALLSFSRTFVFIIGAILIFPVIFGEIGIWLAVPFAELLGAFLVIFYLIKKKDYGYLR